MYLASSIAARSDDEEKLSSLPRGRRSWRSFSGIGGGGAEGVGGTAGGRGGGIGGGIGGATVGDSSGLVPPLAPNA